MKVNHFKKRYGSKILPVLVLAAIMAFTALTISAAPYSDAGDGIDGPRSQVPAAAKGRSYIVLMELSPAASYDGDLDGFETTRAAKGEKFDATSDAAEAYSANLLARQDAVLAAAGVSETAVLNRYTTALNGFSAILSESQVEAVSSQAGVTRVMADAWRQPTMDSVPTFLGLSGPGGAWETGYTGEGVYVGVIDSGIWPEHPSFADDGSYIPHGLTLADTAGNPACNFGNMAHNPDDVAFSCNNKLVAARQMLQTYRALIGAEDFEFDSARDDHGHGTHTASTAAGNRNVPSSIFGRNLGLVSGVAPRAYVLAYKGLGAAGGFTSDLVAAIDQAVVDGVDVINYSVGGGPTPPGADEMAFLFAADSGVHVATSAGNSGPAPGSMGNPGTVPWLTSVGANTQERFFKGDIVLGNGTTLSGASITPGVSEKPLVDAADAGGDLCKPGTLDSNLVAGKIVLCRRGDASRVDKSFAVFQAGGAGMILYNTSDEDDLSTDNHWVPAVHVDLSAGLVIKTYILTGHLMSFKSFVPVAAGDSGSGGGGQPPGSSAAAKIVNKGKAAWSAAPSMTYFSSRGPNPVSPDLIKPDITAPGIQILAGNTPTPFTGVPGQLFQVIGGTSMSSPQIAGVFALIKQAHPSWPPAVSKSAIMTTASQDVVDNDRVSPADPFDMGAGHVDAGDAAAKGSLFHPGLVYYAGLFDYAAYTCGAGFAVFTPESCDYLDSLGVPFEAYNLNLPSIGLADVGGSKKVTRAVTSVAPGSVKYTVSVEAPAGYSVTVDPSTFTIANGASQSFDVTIKNNSGPVGEWRFGSLTWKGGAYEVYSPIAVKSE